VKGYRGGRRYIEEGAIRTLAEKAVVRVRNVVCIGGVLE